MRQIVFPALLPRVTRGGASFLHNLGDHIRTLDVYADMGTCSSLSDRRWGTVRTLLRETQTSNWLSISLIAESTTAQLACCKRGVARSIILSAWLSFWGEWDDIESRIKTCPHSVHSFRAASSLWTVLDSRVKFLAVLKEVLWTSARAATAFATTMGLLSARSSWSWRRNPLSWTSSGLISNSFATHIAAVFLT